VFVSSGERRKGRALYEVLVEHVRSSGLAGASVFPVEMGFGADGQVRDVESEYRSHDIPVVVEVVDSREKLDRLLHEWGPMLDDGVAALATVRAAWRGGQARGTTACSAGDCVDIPAAVEEAGMSVDSGALRLTIYIGSADTWNGRNLAVEIVERCRRLGLAGATVGRGILGFGKSSVVHRAQLLGLSQDLPERVEVIDQPDRIAQILPELEGLVAGGLIVLEDVRVIHYGHHRDASRG
jgi:PII-like signaling protein